MFYNAQDLASGAIRRLVRIQGQTPNFIIPRRQYNQNDPYVALIVNVDWYGVQSLLADEVTRLAPYIPGLDAQVQAARQAAARGAAEGAPEPEQELNPDPAVRSAADRQEQDLDDYTDVEVDYTDVEVEPEEFPPEGTASAAAVSPPPGLDQPEHTQEGQEAQQDQVEAEAAAGDAAPAEAEPEEEEEEIVAHVVLAPEGAASGAPEEFPLDTGDSPEVELPPEGNEQGLDQVQASPPEPPVAEGDGEAAVAAAEAEVDAEVEPVAVQQEEGAESEHPLAYHPISSVLARPTILRPAVTGYPTLRIDRTGIWQLVAAEQSESAAARGALPGAEAADSVEPLEPSTDADPFQLPQQACVSPRQWIRNPSWIQVFLSGGVPEELQEVYHIGTSEVSGDDTRPSGSRPTISVAAPAEGAAVGAPGVRRNRQHFAPPTDILGSLAPFRATEGRTPVVDAPVVEEEIRPVSTPAASASGPPRIRVVGEPRPRPEPAEGEEPPAKRPALVVPKSSQPKVPQKARPRVRVRLAQEVQEVEPESYDVRERSPLRSAPSSSSGIVRPSAVPPTSAPASEGAASGAPFTFGAPVGDQAPIAPRVSAPPQGAANGAPEGEERGSVRRFLSPDPESERPATKAALGLPEPEPEVPSPPPLPPPPEPPAEVVAPPPLPPPPPLPAQAQGAKQPPQPVLDAAAAKAKPPQPVLDAAAAKAKPIPPLIKPVYKPPPLLPKGDASGTWPPLPVPHKVPPNLTGSVPHKVPPVHQRQRRRQR